MERQNNFERTLTMTRIHSSLPLLAVLITMLLLATGCNDDSSSPSAPGVLSDAKLIDAIQNSSSKTEIEVAELPPPSKSTLESDYSEYMPVNAQHAYSLGYQVALGGLGERAGRAQDVFFAEDGRRLSRDGGLGNDGRPGEDRDDDEERECFEVVLPVTFIMPDGSTIEVATEDDYQLIRDWYDANPDVDEEPEYQYPIEIIYWDGEIVIINNADELHQAWEDCDEDDDDGGNRP